MLGQEFADGFQVFCRGTVHIHADGAVHMGVNKAGNDPGTFGIDGFRPLGHGTGKLDLSLNDVQDHILKGTVHIDLAVFNIVVHNSS